jgi:hypothetical protein
MNIDTPYFRTGLTVAAIWLAIAAYLVYSGYRDSYQSPEFAHYGIPLELTARCGADEPVFSGSDVQYRKPTQDETNACYNRASQTHLLSIKYSNQAALDRSWKSFLLFAAIPVSVLLLVVAFWQALSLTLISAVSRYLNWVRFGSRRAGD